MLHMTKKSMNALVALVFAALFAGVILPAFLPGRTRPRTSATNICVSNLRQIDGAKEQWALENHKSTNDVPTMEDLQPWLGRPLVCPRGGTYIPDELTSRPDAQLEGRTHYCDDAEPNHFTRRRDDDPVSYWTLAARRE